ncbi:hypothetical protein FVEG_04426 [Fusarium verticillioides 7600]|uniref:Heterokaryon incompatibility domain-containing protein n=1 Tax=Gibberella moniliformis (strain M3125 / FGSC 7600) TaxID=334819 RepID=W7M5A0_GIBM7|nr:hypothetical protein FVEG_04426 [Fusarium verticillioides 7600]EWG42674.1 hypothetical protein FVEG_04426 [Fusarium verticillioides 7600]
MATSSVTKAGSVHSAPPGLDIFKTPENTMFYSANLYQILDKSKQEIRLIEISTQTGDGILECKLLPATLLTKARKQYLALSYCAGDPTDTKEIRVSGVRCNIFANLHHALVLARQYWMQSSGQGPLRLWVDQLCINQHNLSERSHQVGFMREIYQSAERTLACLSTSPTSGEGLKWFNDLCDAVTFQQDDGSLQGNREGELGTEEGTEPQGAILERAILSDTSRRKRNRRYTEQQFRVLHYLLDRTGSDKFANGWNAFCDLLSSPWWNRAWICQEFIVSGQVSFMFGHYSASWERCSKVLQDFCEIHGWFLMNRTLYLLSSGLPMDGPEACQLDHIHDIVQERDLHRQVDHVRNALRMKIRWSGSMDIKTLLSHSRSCKSSDDRDRVYAMLGLASPGYNIFPDYSSGLSASEVMIMTTRAIIEKEDSLGVLAQATRLVQRKNLDVPSWVADWSSTEAADMDFTDRQPPIWSIMPQESPQCAFETITDPNDQMQAYCLRVYGTFFTRIKVGMKSWPEADFNSVEGWVGNALISITDGDEVWILQGLRVPIVLRPYCDGYRVVSCAFITKRPSKDDFGTLAYILAAERSNRRRIILY